MGGGRPWAVVEAMTDVAHGYRVMIKTLAARGLEARTTGYLLGFPATLFLSTVLQALRGLMSGVEKWSVPGLRATSQNILWSTMKVNEACACMVLGPHTSCGKS